MTRFLRAHGAEVEAARDGKQAVAMARKGHYDVILMDVQMPEMDGYAATKTLRRDGITIPIIALTAHAMLEEKERCLEAGCNEFMTKPLDIAALVRTVDRYGRSGKRG